MNENISAPAPELGTREAAVQTCVSLISSVTGQREALTAYWLDLYYQVRRDYEISRGAEQNPSVLRIEDAYR